MFSRLFSHSPEKTIVVADVESGSVGFALLSIPKKGPVRIEAAARTPMKLDDASPEQALTGALQTVPEIFQKLSTTYTARTGKGIERAEEGYVFFHAPWVRAYASRLEGNLGSERTIQEDMIRSLSREALKHMEGLDQSRFLEASVLRVDLNGYPTKKPEGKKASSVSVTALAADVDGDAHTATLQTLGSTLPGRTWKERSGVRAFTSLIAERTSQRRDYLLIDMGSLSTDITAVRKNELTDHIVVSEGLRTLLRRLTPQNGIPEETLSLLAMLVSDHCDEDACGPLREALGRADTEIAHAFGEAFATLSKTRRLPNAIVLAAHPAIAPWLEHFFARLDFGQFTITTEPFSVIELTPNHMAEDALFAEPSEEDTGIALVSAFIRTQEQST